MNDQFDYNASNITPNPFQTPPPQDPQKNENGFAVAALVLGIVSFVFTLLSCCGMFFVSPILSIVAIIMAFVSKRNGAKMSGMAIAGLVLAFVSLLIIAVFIVLVFILAISPVFWAI